MEKVIIKVTYDLYTKTLTMKGWKDGTLQGICEKSFKIYPKKEWERIERFMKNYKGRIRFTRDNLFWEPESWEIMRNDNITVYECDDSRSDTWERIVGNHFGNRTIFNWLEEISKNSISVR